MTQLSCRNLSLGYDYKEIIKNLNFEVEQGDYLIIVGENGTGKTTLIKAIAGLIKPIKGNIIFGDDIKPNQIGYLPQQTEAQKDFPASVLEVVRSGLLNKSKWRPFFNKKEIEIAKRNIDIMGLTPLIKKSYRELSGGQQQRVLLARAFCATEKILLLDEPVSGLDPIVTHELYELIKELNDQGITIIMISHDVSESLKYAKHILHIDNNSFFGTTEEYINSKYYQSLLVKDNK